MESALQSKIIRDLKSKGWIPLKVVLSNMNGWPDVTAYRNKVAVFIEVKDKGEKARPLQLHRHEELRQQGFDVYVIDTWIGYKNLEL